MSVELVMFKADGTRRGFPVAAGTTVIGRKNTCGLRIPLTSVSRQHCEVVLEGDAATLRDLGSSNGTFLNGQRVQQAPLSAGDEITVGPVVFTVVIDGQPEDITPTRTTLSSDSTAGFVAPAIEDEPLGVDPDTDRADGGAVLAQAPGDAASDSGLDLSGFSDDSDISEVQDEAPGELSEDEALAALSSAGGASPGSAESSMFEINFDDDDESGAGFDVEVLSEEDEA